MLKLTRRTLTGLIAGAGLLAATGLSAAELTELKIGYQKTNLPVIARQQQVIEKRCQRA